MSWTKDIKKPKVNNANDETVATIGIAGNLDYGTPNEEEALLNDEICKGFFKRSHGLSGDNDKEVIRALKVIENQTKLSVLTGACAVASRYELKKSLDATKESFSVVGDLGVAIARTMCRVYKYAPERFLSIYGSELGEILLNSFYGVEGIGDIKHCFDEIKEEHENPNTDMYMEGFFQVVEDKLENDGAQGSVLPKLLSDIMDGLMRAGRATQDALMYSAGDVEQIKNRLSDKDTDRIFISAQTDGEGGNRSVFIPLGDIEKSNNNKEKN